MSGKDELLDKAIVKAKETEDWQLVEWLRTARGSESATRWYSGKLRDANRVKRRLLNENAKLRKLAKQMHMCLTRPKVYDGKQPYLTATECPYFTEGVCDYNACSFERRLCELGIEVDE